MTAGYRTSQCTDRSSRCSLRGCGAVLVEREIRQIALSFHHGPAATLVYYRDKLGFECLGTWKTTGLCIVSRDEHRIHFSIAEPPDRLPTSTRRALDAYLSRECGCALRRYTARGVEFTRALAGHALHSREFVVKDCDGRLLAFGADVN